MNLLDILILAAVAGWLIFVLVRRCRRKKSCAGCCGHCDGCTGCERR